MELINYIRQSYRRPNRTVLKSLGATDELIEYLLHTPHNTNFNMLGQFNNNSKAVVGTAIVGEAVVD